MSAPRGGAVSRLPDWDRRLDAYLAAAAARPFVWGGGAGGQDCVLFALGAVEAMTGVDGAADIRGRYTTALGALKTMRRVFAAEDLPAAADAFRLRWRGEEVPVLSARRGDLVQGAVALPAGGAAPALGLLGLDGRTAWFAAAPAGLVTMAVRACARAWRVG